MKGEMIKMDEIIKKYEKEIEANLKLMERLGPETNEYASIERVTVEMTKLLLDEKAKSQALKDSKEQVEFERKDSKKSKYIDYGFKAMGILIPATLFIWGTSIGYKLEEDGSITSKTMQRCLGFIKLF